MSDKLFSTGSVAKELSISKARLIYLLDSGHLPDAASRVGGRRLFTAEEVALIREALRRRERAKNAWKEARYAG